LFLQSTFRKGECQLVEFNGGVAVRKLTRYVIDFIRLESGPTAVEYAIILALIATICVGVFSSMGSKGNILSSNAPATMAITGSK
jgi:pilus assembly protein Flp/PilA